MQDSDARTNSALPLVSNMSQDVIEGRRWKAAQHKFCGSRDAVRSEPENRVVLFPKFKQDTNIESSIYLYQNAKSNLTGPQIARE